VSAEDHGDRAGGSGEDGETEMRTYDPADHILYVHLAQDPVVSTPPARVPDERRPPAESADVSRRAALVLLSGGADPDGGAASAPPALRLAQ
jgi:hypothetical protein